MTTYGHKKKVCLEQNISIVSIVWNKVVWYSISPLFIMFLYSVISIKDSNEHLHYWHNANGMNKMHVRCKHTFSDKYVHVASFLHISVCI